MKVITLILLVFCISSNVFSQVPSEFTKDEIIVKFNSTSKVKLKNDVHRNKFENEVLDSLNSTYDVQRIRRIGSKKKRDTYILKFKTEQNIHELIKVYESTKLFEYVEPNYIGGGDGKEGASQVVPNDAHFRRQWGLYNDGTFSESPAKIDADIDMEMAWDIEQGSSSIIIAILDSGLRLNHPDISGRVWVNGAETISNNDDDGNGYVDDTRGWDFVNNDNNPTDDHGHGTNVTGILGAEANNSIGYAGVDWNAKLMICKILDQRNRGLYSWWTEAIYYAVDNGANVLNMSVGGFQFSNAMKDAVDYAYENGVVIVASMGNGNSIATQYPAGYENTIAVGSTNANDERTAPFFWDPGSGSSYGNHIDVVAPGNYIYGLSSQSNTNYNSYWGGTSQAAPLVTGLSALLLAQNPSRSPDEIREIIRNTAEDQVGDPSEDVAGFDIYYGHGRINAYEALVRVVTKTEENDFDAQGLMVYPNPSKDVIYIKAGGIESTVSIADMSGREVRRIEFNSNQELMEVDVTGLFSGIYIITTSDKHGNQIQSERVMIKD